MTQVGRHRVSGSLIEYYVKPGQSNANPAKLARFDRRFKKHRLLSEELEVSKKEALITVQI